ncbi:MAG: hypothetical protein V4729_08755 [Pseudomonadota bacterium]
MKAAYLVIFASLLAFPLTFSLVERQADRHCPASQPCLPRDLHLSTLQQDALRSVYERNRRQQEALDRQTRHALLAVLTPEQRQQLRERDPSFEHSRPDRARTGALPQAQR